MQTSSNRLRETLSKVYAIESDVSDPVAIASLYQRVIQEFPVAQRFDQQCRYYAKD